MVFFWKIYQNKKEILIKFLLLIILKKIIDYNLKMVLNICSILNVQSDNQLLSLSDDLMKNVNSNLDYIRQVIKEINIIIQIRNKTDIVLE